VSAEAERDAAQALAEGYRIERDAALAKVEDYRVQLRDAHNDLLNVRGILSPDGEQPKTPLPLVPTVAPAVAWLVAEVERYRLAWTSARRRAIALKLSNQVRAGQLMGSRIVGEQHKTERDEARAEVVRLGKKVEALIEQNRQIQHRWAEDTARANEAARLSADARDHVYDLRAELAELRERTRNVEHDRDVITAWALRLLDEHGVEVPLAADIYQAIAKYIRALKDDIATYRHAEDRAVQAREEYALEAERLGAQCQHLVNRANEFRAARDHLLEAGKAWLDEGFPNAGATAEHRLASAIEDVIANVPQGQSMWVMTECQADALRALLGLVHYDDLASSWLAMLPAEVHPESAS
jgi:hypothetical protein